MAKQIEPLLQHYDIGIMVLTAMIHSAVSTSECFTIRAHYVHKEGEKRIKNIKV